MTGGTAAAAAGEPDITVPAGTTGAAGILALISELIAAEPDVTAAAARFPDGKGASPLPAVSWLTASISQPASEPGQIPAAGGIARDRGLARYWRPPAAPPATPATAGRRPSWPDQEKKKGKGEPA
jgi:hypothetical protein